MDKLVQNKFNEWLNSKGFSILQVSKLSKISRRTLTKMRDGDPVRIDCVLKIVRFSKGELKTEDFGYKKQLTNKWTKIS